MNSGMPASQSQQSDQGSLVAGALWAEKEMDEMGYRPKVSNFNYGFGLGWQFNPGVNGRIKKTVPKVNASANLGLPDIHPHSREYGVAPHLTSPNKSVMYPQLSTQL